MIQKISDQLLQNAGSVNSPGLYNGKAGLALSLFIAAEYLQDEMIEDAAYTLFKESLITKSNDISFENGLAGIGYTLLYLIEKQYMEADFDEIFGMQYETLIQAYENIEKEPLKLLNSLQAVYFFTKASSFKKADKRIQVIIKKIFEGLELFFIIQFHDFPDIRYINRKADVLNKYVTYLKLVDYSGYPNFSRAVLEDYAGLYRKGKIISLLETGYYLDRITRKHYLAGYEDICRENIKNGIDNIYHCTLSLKEKIDLVKIINKLKYENDKIPNILPDVENLKKERIWQDLSKTVEEKSFSFGYGGGFGRLLIHYINKEIELL